MALFLLQGPSLDSASPKERQAAIEQLAVLGNSQGIPALGTSHVAGGIAAVPPDQKLIGIGWKIGFLYTIKRFQPVEQNTDFDVGLWHRA